MNEKGKAPFRRGRDGATGYVDGELELAIGRRIRCFVVTHSEHGAKIILPNAPQLPIEFRLFVEGRSLAVRVIWREGVMIGLRIVEPGP